MSITLDPNYIAGFVDGEGCFCISIAKHKTLKRGLEVRALFEIELRADDRLILERIKSALQCGTIYDLNYDRYGWQPHVKYKVSNIKDLSEKIIPFFEKHQLHAKKKEVFLLFSKVVKMMSKKQHLTKNGFTKIEKIRDQIRTYSKKHYRNR